MTKKANDYLKTKRGLLAMILGCRGLSIVEAVEKAPSLTFWCGNIKTTLGDDPDAYDTLMDYAYPVLYA